MAVPKSKPCFPLEHRDSWPNTAEFGGGTLRRFGIGKNGAKLAMNCKVNDECRRYRDGGQKKDEFVEMMREAWPYFEAHGGRTFVVVLCAEVIESANFGAILEDISLLHDLGIKFVLVPGSHVQTDELLTEKGCEPKYVGKYRITDPDSLKASMDSAGRISQIIQSKLSTTVASGNFLAAKKRGVVEGIDYKSTGEVKKIDVSRIREMLDSDSIVILSNIGHSSSGEILNCNTYEVATACAMAIGAEKLICIINGSILDEMGHVIRFLSLEDVDRFKKIEIATNYVNVIGDEDRNNSDSNSRCSARFWNGIGFDFDHGNLSELASVCRGGVERVHLVDGNISGVLLKELFQKDGIGTLVASDLYEGTKAVKVTDLPAIRQNLRPLRGSGT